jgi:hypothetical protein
MPSRPEFYREKVAQCERAAALAAQPSNRQVFIDLAKQWRDLANQLEHLERLKDDEERRGSRVRFQISRPATSLRTGRAQVAPASQFPSSPPVSGATLIHYQSRCWTE